MSTRLTLGVQVRVYVQCRDRRSGLAREYLPPARASAMPDGVHAGRGKRRAESKCCVLVCGGGRGTAGGAPWQSVAGRNRGALDNLLDRNKRTILARGTAIPLGRCVSGPM